MSWSRKSVIAVCLIAVLLIVGTLVRVRFVNEFADRPLSEIEIQQGIVAHLFLEGQGLSYDEGLYLKVMEVQGDLGRQVDLEDLKLPDIQTGDRLFSDDPGYAMVQALVWTVAGSERWSHMVTLQLLLEALSAIALAIIAWLLSGRRAAVLSVAALQFVGVSQMYWMAQPYHYAWPLYIVTAVMLGSILTVRSESRLARALWCVCTLILVAFSPFLRSTLLPMAAVVAVYWGVKMPRRRDSLILMSLVLMAVVVGMGVRTTVNSQLLHLDRAARGSMWHAVVAGYGDFSTNPFGIPAADDDVAAHIMEQTGEEVLYPSPAYEALARGYALEVISEDPAYYAKTVLQRFWMSLIDDGAMRWTVKQFGGIGVTVTDWGRRHSNLSLVMSFLAFVGAFALIRNNKVPEALLLGGMWLFLPIVISFIHYAPRYFDGGLGAKYILTAIGGIWIWDTVSMKLRLWNSARRKDAVAV